MVDVGEGLDGPVEVLVGAVVVLRHAGAEAAAAVGDEQVGEGFRGEGLVEDQGGLVGEGGLEGDAADDAVGAGGSAGDDVGFGVGDLGVEDEGGALVRGLLFEALVEAVGDGAAFDEVEGGAFEVDGAGVAFVVEDLGLGDGGVPEVGGDADAVEGVEDVGGGGPVFEALEVAAEAHAAVRVFFIDDDAPAARCERDGSGESCRPGALDGDLVLSRHWKVQMDYPAGGS